MRGTGQGQRDVVNTDQVGCTRAEKVAPRNTLLAACNGGDLLQDPLPLLFSEGVRRGRITLEQMVAVTATNPARLLGLYPPKGTLRTTAPGL